MQLIHKESATIAHLKERSHTGVTKYGVNTNVTKYGADRNSVVQQQDVYRIQSQCRGIAKIINTNNQPLDSLLGDSQTKSEEVLK